MEGNRSKLNGGGGFIYKNSNSWKSRQLREKLTHLKSYFYAPLQGLYLFVPMAVIYRHFYVSIKWKDLLREWSYLSYAVTAPGGMDYYNSDQIDPHWNICWQTD